MGYFFVCRGKAVSWITSEVGCYPVNKIKGIANFLPKRKFGRQISGNSSITGWQKKLTIIYEILIEIKR